MAIEAEELSPQRAHHDSEQVAELRATAERDASELRAKAKREAEQLRTETEARVQELERNAEAVWRERRRLLDDMRSVAQEQLEIAEAAMARFPQSAESA